VPVLGLVLGCGTTRLTDTQRTATEQLLISNAVDQAVGQVDCRALAGQTVFLDAQYLEGTVDRGYLVSTLRQHLLACGCLLQEERNKATYVVEARAGGVGTDRHSLLIGIPQTTVPAVVPGQPTQIPEIPFAKKTDQNGVAKIAVFAYNRRTGEPVFQSGVVQALSTAKDMWVFGAGPFQNGTIRKGTEFAGETLPTFGTHDAAGKPVPAPVPVTRAAVWSESSPGPCVDKEPTTSSVFTTPGGALRGPGVDSPGVIRLVGTEPAANENKSKLERGLGKSPRNIARCT